MSRVVRHTLLAAGVCVGVIFPLAPAAAQATQPVVFAFTVPISVSKLHPAVTAVMPVCNLRLGSDLLPYVTQTPSGWIPLSALPKSVSMRYRVTVPADAGGKSGSYTCRLLAQGALVAGSPSSTLGTLSQTAADVRLKTDPALPDSVAGSFTF